MTAVPRVRVAKDTEWFPALPWYAHCPWCGPVGAIHVSWDGAMWEAQQHAADPCDGIRLARLVARMEYRLEGYRRAYQVNRDRGDLHTAAAYRTVIDNITWDLDRLIKETNR